MSDLINKVDIKQLKWDLERIRMYGKADSVRERIERALNELEEFRKSVFPEYILQKEDGSSIKYNLSDPETWKNMPREDFDKLMREGYGDLKFKEEDDASKKD